MPHDRTSTASATVAGSGTPLDPYIIGAVTYDGPTESEQGALLARLAAVRNQLTVIPPQELTDLMPGDVLLPNIVIPAHLHPEPGYQREIRQVMALLAPEAPTLPLKVQVVTDDGTERFLAWSHHAGVVRMPDMPFGELLAMVSRIWHETAPDVG